MRVLVTGGTGYVGKHLIRHLVSSSYSVYALARSPSALPPGVLDVLQIDLLDIDEEIVVAFLNEHRIEVVVHLAAVMDFYPSSKQTVYSINCVATSTLASACAKAKSIERFIYCSSTETMGGVYPTLSTPRDEEAPCMPNYIYGKSKVKAERLIKEIATRDGLKYVILRPTGLFGRDDDFVVSELIKAVDFGLFFFVAGSGSAKLMFTHVDDAVASITLAIKAPQAVNNTIIICPNEAMTYEDWIRLLASELHRTGPLLHLPVPLVKLAMLVLGPLFNIGKRRVFLFHTNTCDRMLEDRWYSNNKAKQLLGFFPKYTLRERLQQTVREYTSDPSYVRVPISPTMAIFSLFGLLLFLCVYRGF